MILNYRTNARRRLGRPFKRTIRRGRSWYINAKFVTFDDDDIDDDYGYGRQKLDYFTDIILTYNSQVIQ